MFSLIIGTLNRPNAIRSCLTSIFNQKYSNYEIVIIDQSDDDKTSKLVSGISDNRIKYEHVSFKGLSKARNLALKKASGQFFCLMDDDAYYDENYLLEAVQHLQSKRILSGYIYDTVKKKEFVGYSHIYNKRNVTLRMIMRTCPSAGLVIPMQLIKDVGMFDEDFGVGARYGSGEETDLLLRAIRNNYKVMYFESLVLEHPVPLPSIVENEEIKSRKRASYFMGLGALYKKHMINFNMKVLYLAYFENLLKFYIKMLIYSGARKDYAQKQYEAFVNGYNSYEGTKKLL